MKRLIACMSFLVVLSIACVSAEDDTERLRAFQRNFLRASLTTKIQVLQDASDEPGSDMGPLYLQALDFAIENAALLRDDPVARELSILAVRLVGISGYRNALLPLWDLFTLDSNSSVRVEILSAITDLVPADAAVVQKLNEWIREQVSAFRNGDSVDLTVLSEAALTLGALGDENSFPVLFSMSTSGFPDAVAAKARVALYQIEGDFNDLIVKVIRENPATEKLEALRIAIANDNLTVDEKARIAEIALSQALSLVPRSAAEREYQRQLRYESVRVIAENGRFSATDDIIAHFDMLLEEFPVGTARLSHVLESIDALGSMGNHEAAVRLSLYLDVLNSDVEGGKTVEEQIVLTVMKNLGKLGDKVAFDYLLYVGYLEYSERVKTAARDAISRLQI
jgi:hypothetical protein